MGWHTNLFGAVKTHATLENCFAIFYLVLKFLYCSLTSFRSQFGNLIIYFHELFL